ncbi:MAG: transcriptional regulator [Candidatus Thorarchaeota archaeon]
MSKGEIIPDAYKGKPANILIAMQMGAPLGFNPVQAVQNIAVIKGKPCLYGDALLSLVRASGLLEEITEEILEDRAICTVKRIGEKPVTRTYTIEDAKKAGLLSKNNWVTHPKRMKQMRARTFALRDVFPDVLLGFTSVEEIQDYPSQKNIIIENNENQIDTLKKILQNKNTESCSINPNIEYETIDFKVTEPSSKELRNGLQMEKINQLKKLIEQTNTSKEQVEKWLTKAKVEKIDDLPENIMAKINTFLLDKISDTTKEGI